MRSFLRHFVICLSLFLSTATAFAANKTSTQFLKQEEVKKFYEELYNPNYYENFPEIVNKDDPYYDSDVELSIEDLQKKYPLNWVENKFGKFSTECCSDLENPKRSATCSKPLICGLYSKYEDHGEVDYSYYFLEKYELQNFSEKEIKSLFVNHSQDKRVKDAIRIVYDYFYHHQVPGTTVTSKNEKKLLNFIYSPKIFFYSIKNMDETTICSLQPWKSPYKKDLIFFMTLEKNISGKSDLKKDINQQSDFLECTQAIKSYEKIEWNKEFKNRFLKN